MPAGRNRVYVSKEDWYKPERVVVPGELENTIVVATWECRRILPEGLNIPNWKSGFFKKCKIPYYLNSL